MGVTLYVPCAQVENFFLIDQNFMVASIVHWLLQHTESVYMIFFNRSTGSHFPSAEIN